ncbi:MAG: response regulator [Myxococcales bacterium]|jgi:two-component system chemotaxis response regulator CheY|nr:response regulator [Myxococcales bacterium]
MSILIVDDSKAMRMIVRRALRQAGYGGYDVQEAGNGKEALDAIHACPPELVLSDWNMPEMSGIELLRALSSESVKVPFGFVTSEGTPEIREQATSNGASFLIVKPFNPDSFGEALRPLLPPKD